jgi:TnpA family transposase
MLYLQGEQTMTIRINTGENLRREKNIPARKVYFHKDGTFYENLDIFPGALADTMGYLLFQTEEDYYNSSYLNIGIKTNVPNGISKVPGYVFFKSS